MPDFAGRPVTNWDVQQDMLGRGVIKYLCPNCGGKLSSPIKDAGNADSCPECNCLLVLPADAAKRFKVIQREREAQKEAEEKARQDARAKERLRREAAAETERHQHARTVQAENAALAAQQAAAGVARQNYLQSLSEYRKKYKVVLESSAEAVEHTCNHMGFEGWQLEQSFTETFYSCCGGYQRKFVLVFSQPLQIGP